MLKDLASFKGTNEEQKISEHSIHSGSNFQKGFDNDEINSANTEKSADDASQSASFYDDRFLQQSDRHS